MNYRHAFHAGNFADCVKHALLLEVLDLMQRKEKPLLVLDTHAGAGRYDLMAGAGEKTGEWRAGIGRILGARPPALAVYCRVVESLGLYPGSPAIMAARLRPGDRLVACELHKEDAASLRLAFRDDPNVAVHERDGYEAMRAFLPPPEKRALVLVDPPYERNDEFEVLARSLAGTWKKFPSAVFAAWYPLKHLAPERKFFEWLKMTALRDVIAVKFWLRPPLDPTMLNGCGLVVVNPPFGFEARALPVLEALAGVLGEAGAGCAIERLIDE